MFRKQGRNFVFHKDWPGEKDSYELAFFEYLFQDCQHFDEIKLTSVFGELEPIKRGKHILEVQYSGEPGRRDASLFDLNIVPGNEIKDNVIHAPFMMQPLFKLGIDKFITRRTLKTNKTKFCLFAVSNPENTKRNDFFKMLSSYKRVDSCGKVMNNLGYRCPGSHYANEFCNFISDYKFMICFENSSIENYLTEKILNAYNCGTIPIYWGCPEIANYVNMSSILYLKPDYTDDDVHKLLNEIEMLDNDDNLYRKKYESVFFKDGKVPDFLNIDKLRGKITKVVRKLE